MRILHFILGKANKDRSNGVNQVIAGLCKYSAMNGQSIKVIGLASNAEIEGEIVQQDGFEVEVYSKLSVKLLRAVIKHLKWCDILHLHGVYNLQNILVGKLAQRYSIPFVITAHNGFAPQMKKMRKKLFDFLLQKRHMENADAVHILAQEEASEILAICKPKRFIYVPNGIDLDDFPISRRREKLSDETKEGCGLIVLGYLGRISEEKNLTCLVEAISKFGAKRSVSLKLAGPNSAYLEKLLSLDNSVNIEWVGPKYGSEKIEFIKSLDLFVHPSKADVFSISAMECLAIGTPLLITRDSKASYFYNFDGFFMCEATSFGINQGITQAIDRMNEWTEVTSKGQFLISSLFNWNTASLSLIEGYKSVLRDKKQ
jgi:glycosyltransferase involved in cell wall biosynthesis